MLCWNREAVNDVNAVHVMHLSFDGARLIRLLDPISAYNIRWHRGIAHGRFAVRGSYADSIAGKHGRRTDIFAHNAHPSMPDMFAWLYSCLGYTMNEQYNLANHDE